MSKQVLILAASDDHRFTQKLTTHLVASQVPGLVIKDLHNSFRAGEQLEMRQLVFRTDCVVTLLSASFFAEVAAGDGLLAQAYQCLIYKQREYGAHHLIIFPIYIRPFNLEGLDNDEIFRGRWLFPSEAPIASYKNKDEAFYEASVGIIKALRKA